MTAQKTLRENSLIHRSHDVFLQKKKQQRLRMGILPMERSHSSISLSLSDFDYLSLSMLKIMRHLYKA